MTDSSEYEKLPTFACQICGRHFVQSSLDKHIPACKSLTKMQRKVFDSGKQRAQNSDIPLSDVRKVAKEREKFGGVYPRPSTNWRERHEEFLEVVSASKEVDKALKTGAPLPPPPRTAAPSDYVRCDFCGRSFNKNSAERHIEFCSEIAMRKGPVKSANNTRRQTSSGKPPAKKDGTFSANAAFLNRNGAQKAPQQSAVKPPPSSSSTSSKSSTNAAAIKKRSSSVKKIPEESQNGHAELLLLPSRRTRNDSTSSSQIPVPTKRSSSLSTQKKTNNNVASKGKTNAPNRRS